MLSVVLLFKISESLLESKSVQNVVQTFMHQIVYINKIQSIY